jgi:hypothetical protein
MTEHEIEQKPETVPAATSAKRSDRKGRRLAATVGAVVAVAALMAASTVGYLYATTPVTVREPLMEHYHFRMQVVIDGKAENFGSDKYQAGYSKDNCNALLTDSPIHFHDNKDQFVHIHWEGMTGGQVLKHFGWNFIGGPDGAHGYRFDAGNRLVKVPIHGKDLPTRPDDTQYFVYVRNGEGYTEKKWQDFLDQDLEKFFGVTSNFPAHKLNQEKRKSSLDSLRQWIAPTAYAHNGEDHGTPGEAASHDQTELKRINNLLGDVVIFVQKERPGESQITERFGKLEPLTDSTCGG